jgi:hypothetical protein
MAAVSTKSTFALQITGSEAENAMRKLVFAAAVGIQDGALSNLAQPLVRIALKLLMLLRVHRAAHCSPMLALERMFLRTTQHTTIG